jgi:hypothetical protein
MRALLVILALTAFSYGLWLLIYRNAGLSPEPDYAGAL